MVVNTVSKAMSKIFGSRNARLIKAYMRRVERINSYEPEVARLSDAQIREKVQGFRDHIEKGGRMAQIQPEVMAVGREAMDRAVGMRNVLNPEYEFDPSVLSESGQKLFAEVQAKAAAAEPEEVLGGEPAPGWLGVGFPVELYDAIREAYPESKRPFRARPFDVQLIGGMVLSEGRIAEMKTGEGKTIVAPLACFAAVLEGLQCHVVTVNDYLVQRDRDWVFPFYYYLGLTVGAIHPMHMQPPEQKAQAYRCNVLYATNSELGFDYLRDNMKLTSGEQVQKHRDFCIVDEIDSILIDEARTPLIISGPAHQDAPRYPVANDIARHLIQMQKEWDAADKQVQETEMRIEGLRGDIRNARDKAKTPAMKEEIKQLESKLPGLEATRDQHTQYYEVEMEKKATHLTHEGIAEAQKKAGIGSFYVGNNMDFPHLLENAVRAHVIYQRDKDYVVQNGEVVIVDENTGRLMVGRQWSDGLHQAVEAKENVKIKEETQTLATVTIQNFFKLYKRLAGMTGTAITEATEFDEIYELDVVSVPTNVPVERVDRDDLIFMSEKDKYNGILDEIKRVHDLGRPVLVGTTSVENSEKLSDALTKKHGVKHEVLNAKQHERESNIVEDAGYLGSVVIATNMAGRGTDIRLQPIDRAALIRHWQQRNLLPKQASADLDDDALLTMSYRHQLQHQLKLKAKEVEALSDEEVRTRLLRHWVATDGWVEPDKAQQMSAEQCFAELDQLPDYRRHRQAVFTHVEEMGGLHIIGTERHEARRIDNQLRGRAGRQGDHGSSRFFISLEDPLMQMFAGKTTMTALSKLGMKEGDAIEHRWVTRSVERAQRKVEERNYEIRKNLLEYDEVMEYQRNDFYSTRQDVLEGTRVQGLIFEHIEDAVVDAVQTYCDPDYPRIQAAEWCRQNLDVSIEPTRLHLDDHDDLVDRVRRQVRIEVVQVIDVTLGEYMSDELPPSEWDLRGLSQWAMSRFSVDLKQNKLREMNTAEVHATLAEAAKDQVDKKDLSGLKKFMAEHYGQTELAEWAKNKFAIELDPAELAQMQRDDVAEEVFDKAQEAYAQREITYPVQFIMDVVFQGAQQDQQWAVEQLIGWARQRYDLEWTAEEVTQWSGQDIYDKLVAEAERWLRGGRLREFAEEKAEEYRGDLGGLSVFLSERFGAELTPKELEDADDLAGLIQEKGRASLRAELTRLERFVLLQILDQAWKDHLYAMDQLKDSIGLRGFAEKDPKIEYKREGSAHYEQMGRDIRERVTDLIFRAKLTPNVQVRSAYGDEQQAQHPDAPGNAPAPGSAQRQPAMAGGGGDATERQRADLAAADRAGDASGGASGGGGEGDDDYRGMSRKQRRAAQSRERKTDGGSASKSRKRKSR